MKLTPDGTILWQKIYSGPGYEKAQSIVETNDGGYIITGNTTSFGSGYTDVWVLKLTRDGDIIWQKAYGRIFYDYGYSVLQLEDGGYLIAGFTESIEQRYYDALVMKLNSDGTIAWQKIYGGDLDDFAFSITKGHNNEYIISGGTESFWIGSRHVWALAINSDGIPIWGKIYGGGKSDSVLSIQKTQDGGYILAGGTASFGAGKTDMWILKLTPDGNIDFNPSSNAISLDINVVNANSSLNVKDTTAIVKNTLAIVSDTDATVTDSNATIIQQAP
jgi:hypothetical protein